MSTEYSETAFSKIFDSKRSIIQELFCTEYTISKDELTFDLYISPLEEFLVFSLNLNSQSMAVFSFSTRWIEEIQCKNNTVTFHKAKNKEINFLAQLDENLFFEHDVPPKEKNPALKPGIEGYDDYELLEIFDNADLKSENKRIQNFYAIYKDTYKFTLSINHKANSVSLTLANKKRKRPVFKIKFYEISRVKKDKYSLRFFRLNEKNEYFSLITQPFISIQGEL